MLRLLGVALMFSHCCAAVEISAPATPPPRMGMTWGIAVGEAPVGIVLVSCHGLPKTSAGSCDAYVGDTSCSIPLPVLCVLPGNRPAPEGLKTSFYAGWLGGQIALAPAQRGDAFEDRLAADAWCGKHFGTGWRMGEHHDRSSGSGGWAFYGIGAGIGANAGATRFWTAIDDTEANCWNRASAPVSVP